MKRSWQIALIAITACAEPEMSHMSVSILAAKAVSGVSKYDVRIFGAAATCDDAMSNPSAYFSTRTCTPEELDATIGCHSAHALLSPGKTERFESILAGHRTVFVVGTDDSSMPIAKGCTSTDVAAGKVASVKIETTAY